MAVPAARRARRRCCCGRWSASSASCAAMCAGHAPHTPHAPFISTAKVSDPARRAALPAQTRLSRPSLPDAHRCARTPSSTRAAAGTRGADGGPWAYVHIRGGRAHLLAAHAGDRAIRPGAAARQRSALARAGGGAAGHRPIVEPAEREPDRAVVQPARADRVVSDPHQGGGRGPRARAARAHGAAVLQQLARAHAAAAKGVAAQQRGAGRHSAGRRLRSLAEGVAR
eukprot:3538341-Prymnesium_polylepis.1